MAVVFSRLVIRGTPNSPGRYDITEPVQDDTVEGTRQLKRSLLCVRGFTLTELIIVLGIMGIVLMLAQTWLVSQLPHWRLNGAARQVASDLLGAKMKAVVERNRQRVFFQDNHRYVLLDDDNNNGKSDPGEYQEARDIQDRYRDVTMTASNNPSFLPRGTASNLASITLSNSAGKRIITVSITGRVKVKS
jgi:type IV fimbrial biogenesis protein FimT